MVGAKYFSLLGAAALAGMTLGSQAALAIDDPAGYWATEKHESQIKIFHCGTDAICGSIFWMRDPKDAKGNLKLDRKNEDEAKRKHPILGLQLINMQADDEKWKGTVYNPENGKTYSATLKVMSKDEVELEGCVAYVLCGNQHWTREEPKQTAAATPVKAAGAPKAGADKAGEAPAAQPSE